MKNQKIYFLLAGVTFLLLLTTCSKKKSDDNNNLTLNCTWTTVFFDDFQRVDGPVGPNYRDTLAGGSGVYGVVGDMLKVTGTGYWGIFYKDSISANIIRVSIKFIGDTGYYAGVSAKFSNVGIKESGYAGYLLNSSIVIQKYQVGNTTTLSNKSVTIVPGHQYQITLVVDNAALSVTLEDLTHGTSVGITATDNGTLCIGKAVGINGCCLADGQSILMDDYKVEICQ
jgi:hypothetical protein